MLFLNKQLKLIPWPVSKLTALLICVVKQGEPWIAALAGHQVDPLKQQAEQQRLMLERFQQEVCIYIVLPVALY